MRHRLLTLLTAALTMFVARPAPVRAEAAAVEYVDEYGTALDLTPQPVLGYKRGKKVKVKVISIGYELIEVATGKAFLAMREAARADGIDLYVFSGFRAMDHQKRLYQAYREGYGNKAAKPGYSNHQLGKALDIYIGDAGIYDWLEAHAKQFGFKRTVAGEPWHWEYVKKPAKKKAKKKSK
jgi:LAS superfamily LD-carboxypeptidase LdcB